MLPELSQIKKLRKEYSLSQKELSELAGVSQSFITKIESGKIEPTYSRAKKIFQVLKEIGEDQDKKAKDVMKRKVLFASSDQKLDEVIKVMKKKGISQLPVKDNGNVVGLISEKGILNALIGNKKDFQDLVVSDIMEDNPPLVPINTKYNTLLEILKENPLIIIVEKGKVKGIVSRSDLLGLERY